MHEPFQTPGLLSKDHIDRNSITVQQSHFHTKKHEFAETKMRYSQCQRPFKLETKYRKGIFFSTVLSHLIPTHFSYASGNQKLIHKQQPSI